MQRTQNHTAIWTGVGVALMGFAVIGLAWNSASELDFIQGQFPYLVSGGLTGIGLIVVGVGVLLMEILRRDGAERAVQMERLASSLAQLSTTLGADDPYDATATGEFRPRPRPAAMHRPPGSNGQGATGRPMPTPHQGRADETVPLRPTAGGRTFEPGA